MVAILSSNFAFFSTKNPFDALSVVFQPEWIPYSRGQTGKYQREETFGFFSGISISGREFSKNADLFHIMIGSSFFII